MRPVAMEDFSYTISPNNIHLESSFLVRKEAFERELLAMREKYPDSMVWKNRSLKSLVREWAAHNALFALGIFRSRTCHTDLNWPQRWVFRIGYAIIGRVVWPFIK